MKRVAILLMAVWLQGMQADDGRVPVRAYKEIGTAALQPNFQIRLKPDRSPENPELTELSVRLKNLHRGRTEPATVYLAVTEGRLSTHVGAGENAGRQVAHAAVVRS